MTTAAATIAQQPLYLVPSDTGAVPIAQQVEHLDLLVRGRAGSGLVDLAEQVANGVIFFIGRRDRVIGVDDAWRRVSKWPAARAGSFNFTRAAQPAKNSASILRSPEGKP